METKTRYQLSDEWEQYNDEDITRAEFEEERFVKVDDILKYRDRITRLNDRLATRLFGVTESNIRELDKILTEMFNELSQSNPVKDLKVAERTSQEPLNLGIDKLSNSEGLTDKRNYNDVVAENDTLNQSKADVKILKFKRKSEV